MTGCTAITCISAEAVGQLIALAMGMWATGFGLGQAVAWTRKLRDAV